MITKKNLLLSVVCGVFFIFEQKWCMHTAPLFLFQDTWPSKCFSWGLFPQNKTVSYKKKLLVHLLPAPLLPLLIKKKPETLSAGEKKRNEMKPTQVDVMASKKNCFFDLQISANTYFNFFNFFFISKKISVVDILHDPQKFSHFAHFLELHHYRELRLFWEQIHQYRNLPHSGFFFFFLFFF